MVELAATEARDRMTAGTLTARALTQAYLNRIAAIDDAGPRLNAVIEVNPKALAEADALDAERRSGKIRGPLHGIPVLLKDNIDVAGMVNSAGSLALADNRPAHDAFLVGRLRAAGVVIVGKTNLSEWANFRSSRSTSGWSSRGGQTKNPYVLDRNPCGSSSGTGTAIAASLAAIGVGTETDGSIICPAAVAGLVGLKPTVGVVSRRGIIPISVSQDTAGPMGRTVADVALLMTGLAAVDQGDPGGAGRARWHPRRLPGRARCGRAQRQTLWRAAAGDGLSSRRGQGDGERDRRHESGGRRGGGRQDRHVQRLEGAEYEVLLYEFKDGLNTYLRASGSPHTSLEALIAWNTANASKAMPFFGQEIFEQAQKKGPLTEPAYRTALAKARRLAGKEGLLAALDGDRLDAVIASSVSPAWPIDHVLGDHFLGAGYGMAAVAGTPSLTIPVGDSYGLPVGLTFMGRAYSEPQLIGFGYALEQIVKARKAPTYRTTLPD